MNGLLRMRIIISVINDLVTDQRVNRIAGTLQANGHDVILVGRRLKNSLQVSTRTYVTKRFRLLSSRSVIFYAEYNLRLLFFLLFHKSDLLIANDLDTLPANYFASVIRRKKLMYDCHELFTEVPELIGRVFTRHFWIILEKLMLPRIKFSSTVNNSIAEYYKDRYKIDMKIIRNLHYYREVQHKIINKLSPENKKVILYQGSVNRGRGVDLAIRAVKLIENAVFVVIGDGDVLEEMKEIVKELQLANKVVFTGRIPFWELHQYTIQADVGLVLEENLGLNYYYSLSNKLFDYIQARVPVLGSPFPEIMNIIENYGVGLIADSHEIAEIAGKINCMLYDSESRITWKNNLNIAAGELCWEKEEKVLLELIKTIQV